MKRNFANWLAAYNDYTAHSEAPSQIHFWTGVSTIAGALRRRVWRDEGIFQWTPNFYIVLVGPPGIVTKSTSQRLGLNLLTQVPHVKLGPQSLTWQALTERLQESFRMEPYGADFLSMSCLTCSVSELGTFLNPSDKELVQVLTAMWDGQLEVWERKTKMSGDTKIVNPWLNIIGATTPAWIKDNIPEAMIGGGLTSRIIFVYADQKRHLVPHPSLIVPPADHEEKAERLVEDLCIIGELIGNFEYTPEALAFSIAWYEDLWHNRPIHMASERYDGYVGRKQGHLQKLAMIMSVSRSNDLVIGENDLIVANSFLEQIEKDMGRVFQSIGLTQTSRNVKEILAFVRAYNGMARIDLLKMCYTIMDPKAFDEAL